MQEGGGRVGGEERRKKGRREEGECRKELMYVCIGGMSIVYACTCV